jgi:hypothetical protein
VEQQQFDTLLLEKILNEIQEIKLTMVRLELLHSKNTESLEEHVKRTNLLEEDILRTKKYLVKEIAPFKKLLVFFKGSVWAIGVLASLVVFLKQMGYLSKIL